MVWVLFNRQLSILPGRFQPSTFDVWGLNYCVRDGNRWIPPAIATGLFCWRPKPSKLHRRENKRVFLFKFTCQCMLPEGNTRKLLIQSLTLCKFDPLNHSFRSDSVSFKSSPRHISTGQLNALLQLHTRPINLIFFKVSYQIALWEISS